MIRKSEQWKRVALARALGFLHRAGPLQAHEQLPLPIMPASVQWGRDSSGVWDWIGSARARPGLRANQDHLVQWEDLQGHANFIREDSAQSHDGRSRADRIDALPRYATTGDAQLKNVLALTLTEDVRLVNLEVLSPPCRMLGERLCAPVVTFSVVDENFSMESSKVCGLTPSRAMDVFCELTERERCIESEIRRRWGPSAPLSEEKEGEKEEEPSCVFCRLRCGREEE